MGRDRRRYQRVGVTLDATVETPDGRYPARTLDLSPYGVKVALADPSRQLPSGLPVAVELTLPGEGASIRARARVVRGDGEGIALEFADVKALDFAQLREFVDDSVKGRPGDAPPPVRERRRSVRVEVQLEARMREPEQQCGWRGKTVDVGMDGVRLAVPSGPLQPQWGASVRVELTFSADEPPLSIGGLVWRRDPDAVTVLFVSLGREERERLKGLLRDLRVSVEAPRS